MIRALFLSLLCGGVLFVGIAQAQTVFFDNVPDVPVMPGLEQVQDSGLVFDKPGGRIAEMQAHTDTNSAKDIVAYYKSVLPQFGWIFNEELGVFSRENESLSIFIDVGSTPKLVTFTIAPK